MKKLLIQVNEPQKHNKRFSFRIAITRIKSECFMKWKLKQYLVFSFDIDQYSDQKGCWTSGTGKVYFLFRVAGVNCNFFVAFMLKHLFDEK